MVCPVEIARATGRLVGKSDVIAEVVISPDYFRVVRHPPAILAKRQRTFELPTAELAGTWVC